MALIWDIDRYGPGTIPGYDDIPVGRKVGVLSGGPPSQAFSTAGAGKGPDDERGNVFLRYSDIAEEICPTYVVTGSMRGLLSAQYPYKDMAEPIKGGVICVIQDHLSDVGYTVPFELYDSADSGAQQTGGRVMMTGKLGRGKVPCLSPALSDGADFGLPGRETPREGLPGADGTERRCIEFPEKRLKHCRMLTEGQYWEDLPPETRKGKRPWGPVWIRAAEKQFFTGGWISVRRPLPW